MRNIRTLNQTANQKIESQKVLTRIGDLSYRDLGVFARMFLIDQGKALIMGGGLIVSATTGMTVSVSAGKMFQRIDSGDVIPGIVDIAQTIVLDAASGVARTDTIQCQITYSNSKLDSAEVVTDPTLGTVAVQNVYRDKSYTITIGKLTGSTTATPGTAGSLTGTIDLSGVIDCQDKYILNICDGEDGNFQEINIKGATPAATTLAEIVSKINLAVGRTMASTSSNHLVLTGYGTGQASYFEIKAWRLRDSAEISIGASTTTITSGMIKDVTVKNTWASDGSSVNTWGLLQGLGITDNPTFSSVLASGSISGASVLASGSISGASVAATGGVSGLQLTASIADGTAPLIITSKTKINNLNCDKFDGADLSTDGTMLANSDVLIPSQKAIVTFAGYSRRIVPGDFTLSWSSATVFRVAAGKVLDSTSVYPLNLSSAFTKTISAWAAGTGNGGKMSAAAIANSTTYTVYVIRKDSDGTVDVGFDVSATTPTMPAGYTYSKRIGCFRTNTSAQIIKFFQHGNMFRFDVQQNDLAFTTPLPNTTRNLLTVSAPENSIGLFSIFSYWNAAPSGNSILINAIEETDSTPSETIVTIRINAAYQTDSIEMQINVDANRQIAYRGTATTNLGLRIGCIGWIDPLL